VRGTLPTHVDVVVIGAGLGGLCAAALLAKSGLSVCVIEKEPNPGGCLAGFERRGYKFDTAIHWLNACGPKGYVTQLWRYLAVDPPLTTPLTRIRRFKGESFDYLLTTEPLQLCEQLMAAYPTEAKGIARFFADARAFAQNLQICSSRVRAPATMGMAERLGELMRRAYWGLPFFRLSQVSAQQGLSRYFRDAELQGIWCSEDDFLSILVPLAWAFLKDYQAPPVGGSVAFVHWLMTACRALQVPVALGTSVSQVLLHKGAAVGVQLHDGTVIKAEAVVASCDLATLYEQMLPDGAIPAAMRARLRAADLYDSCVNLSVGLDVPAESLGLGEELVTLTRGRILSHQGPRGDPETTAITVLSPSVRDASLCSSGRGTLTCYLAAHISYAEHWHSDAGLGRGAAYRAFKQVYAEQVLARVERTLVPGLRSHVELLDVATPLTYRRYTGNRDGTIMGTTPSFRNIRNHVADYKTPVRGLWLAGHWAEYGGGVPMVVRAAANASLLVLQEAGKTQALRALCAAVDNAAAL